MSKDPKQFHVMENGAILTCRCIIASDKFLVSPKEGDSHKIEMLFEPGTDLSVLKNEMGKIALDKLGGDAERAKNLVNNMFLDPNNKPKGGKPLGERFNGWTLVRASSQYCPDFAGPDGNKISIDQIKKEQGILYRGRWGRVILNPYWGTNPENKGVFIGFGDVQLLEHDEPIGFVKPPVEDTFGAVEVEGGNTAPQTEQKSSEGNVDALFG